MADSMNSGDRQPVSWQQAVVSCVAITAATVAMIFVPDFGKAGAAILGAAIAAGVGAFKR